MSTTAAPTPVPGAAESFATAVGGLVGQVHQLQADLGECNVRREQAEAARGRCEDRVETCLQAAAARLASTLPEGRLTYVGCYGERHPATNNPVMTFVGRVQGTRSVVAECARLAADQAGRGDTVVFGVARETECWAGAPEVARAKAGLVAPGRCTSAPDERGQAVGGTNALSVYTLAPRGVEARALRIVRKLAPPAVQPRPQSADLHLAGAVLLDGDGRPLAFEGATAQPAAPVPLRDPRPGEPPAAVDLRALLPAGGGPAFAGPVSLGPEVGSHLTLHLPTVRRVAGVRLWNRSVPGAPEVEERLCGCWVQLIADVERAGAAPVWERPVLFPAPSYQWDVR